MTDAPKPIVSDPAAFLAAAAPLEEIVDVPRLGGRVRCVEPPFDEMRTLLQPSQGKGYDAFELVAICVRDETGARVFTTPEHIDALRRSGWDPIAPVIAACRRVSGLSTHEIEGTVGESEGVPSSASSSDSRSSSES